MILLKDKYFIVEIHTKFGNSKYTVLADNAYHAASKIYRLYNQRKISIERMIVDGMRWY